MLKVEARRARDIITAEAVKAAVSPGRTQTSKAPLRLPYPPEPTPSFTVTNLQLLHDSKTVSVATLYGEGLPIRVYSIRYRYSLYDTVPRLSAKAKRT